MGIGFQTSRKFSEIFSLLRVLACMLEILLPLFGGKKKKKTKKERERNLLKKLQFISESMAPKF